MRTFDLADAADADDDELAAAVAAVSLLLAEGQAQPAAQPAAAWRAAALLEGQGMAPGRGFRPVWASAERGAWASRWSRGVLGS